ncbi:Na/Pi cotransporter family protein [Anaerovorax sp. IOR16]|uniref:Na/Pi cotransporter family protein n=1 Tax=Anaerovorax sp. IOR16 TaxID=2773458 RepID=UPI0019D166E1|nr:Na/Pi cotransporter family protein [Anaerovorax sp. IOR16]
MLTIIFFQVLGGAGLLLYGIEIMKDSLELCTEGRTVKLLELSSKNTLNSILAGAVVTMINQKSSATTVMVVGLVNAGMMSLVQATGVIMGANIGTTVTAQILAFRIELLAPCIVGVAAIFWKYVSNKRVQYIAEIFIGCGIMFIGIIFIESAMEPLKMTPQMQPILQRLSHLDLIGYLYVVGFGFLLTALVRSSSVITGVMIAMAAQGMLTIEAGIPLILGLNIGKCLSALLSSLGTTRTAKRAAVIHLLFNTFGALLVVLFFRNPMEDAMLYLAPHSIPRQIANAHTFFNLGTTIICAPFVSALVKASDKLIPLKRKAETHEVSNLNVRMLETPSIALAQVNNEIYQMASLACDIYDQSFQAVQKTSERIVEWVHQEEENVMRMQKEIEIYLVKLSQKNITDEQHKSLNLLLGVTGDVERISDVSFNISKLALFKKKNSIHLSQNAKEELDDLHNRIMEVANGMVASIKDGDADRANNLLAVEIKIKAMEEVLRENHVKRLNQGFCTPGSGVLYLDLIGHMERVAEHLRKIGIFIIENAKY